MKTTMKMMLEAMAKVATRLRNPNIYTFECEVKSCEQVIVKCFGHEAWFGDCSVFAYDLGVFCKDILNYWFPIPGKKWTLYSEKNCLDADGKDIYPSDYEYCDDGKYVQFVIFAEE